MSGWQTIETAPRAPEDSQECWDILAFFPPSFIEVVYWARGGWWLSNVDEDGPWHGATHWMPLPEAPDWTMDQVKALQKHIPDEVGI